MNLATREEIIAAIHRCAGRLGRPPVYRELRLELNISERWLQHQFGGFTKALIACGLQTSSRNTKTPLDVLFRDWAQVARKLGKLPTTLEQDSHGAFTSAPFARRFRGWSSVPLAMLLHGNQAGLWPDWPDVLKMVTAVVEEQRAAEELQKHSAEQSHHHVAKEPNKQKPREESWFIDGAPTYGEPIISPALAHAPTNEAGVLVLFGSLAAELGYLILHMQTGFPDCVALRRVAGNRCQLTKIELEYESRNFREHKHDPEGCDLIVCWHHNWPECPVRVLELKKFVTQR